MDRHMGEPDNLYSKEKGIMTGIGMINIRIVQIVGVYMVICLAMVLAAIPAQAVDYLRYVDGTGYDDINDGSLGSPWRTIHRGLTEIGTLNLTLTDTYTLYVGQGTYSVGNGETDSTTAYEITTPNIAIKGVGIDSSIVDGSGAASWSTGLTVYADNVTITELGFSGFTGSGVSINRGNNVKVLGCGFTTNASGLTVGGTTSANIAPEIISNNFDLNSNSGISVRNSGAGSVSPFIRSNTISRSGYYGIYLQAMSSTVAPRIYDNTIKDNASYGIYMFADMGAVSPFVSSNRITGNPTGIYIMGSYGSAAPVIRNNLISEPNPTTHDYGIMISTPMSGMVTPEIIHNTLDGDGLTTTGIFISNSPNVIPVIRYNIITNFSGYGIDNEQTGTPEIDYNNVYGNGVDYYNLNVAGTGNISEDPLYEYDFSIPVNSPCVDAIPASDEANNLTVLVADDLIGTSRPRASAAGQNRDYDMGCFEFPYQEYTFTMPGGAGLSSDYRLMTLPLSGIDGGSMLTVFENAFGKYDPMKWRIFAYIHNSDPAEYMEINNANFGEFFSSFRGSAFWVTSRTGAISKEYHVFEGNNSANKRPYSINLAQGWNLISLPWADSSVNENIQLVNVMVSGMNSKYSLLDLNNTLTQQAVWAFGSTGYAELVNPSDTLEIGKGYWIYSFSYGVTLMIPPDNSGSYFTLGKYSKSKKNGANNNVKNLTPPQPPGSDLTAEGGNGCFITSTL